VNATTSGNHSFAALASAMDAADPVTATPVSASTTDSFWSCVARKQHFWENFEHKKFVWIPKSRYAPSIGFMAALLTLRGFLVGR
jgi:hypothetical protein